MSLNMAAGLIPKIEGFQPIPNAVMIPFMEAQSAALAFGFGLNYEYGKRTIRSMSNETFNSLTSEQVAEISAQHTTVILNRFIQAVPQVMPMQTEIFKQYVEIEKLKVQKNIELAQWMMAFAKEFIDDTLAHAMGGHLHPADTVIGTQDTNIDTPFTPSAGEPTYNPENPQEISTITPLTTDSTTSKIQIQSTSNGITTAIRSNGALQWFGTTSLGPPHETLSFNGYTPPPMGKQQSYKFISFIMSQAQYSSTLTDAVKKILFNHAIAWSQSWAAQYKEHFTGF